jgi:PKD repeat protein
MKHHIQHGAAALLLLAATALAGCTLEKQDPPDLAGPSEFGTSITVTISPDVLEQNGASQALVTITARDANGQPLRNVTLRAEIIAGGTLQDFGSLSARTVVTGADGRATLVYTAPPSPAMAVDPFTVIDIGVTPIGSDFGNSVMRFASVRLVPTGVIIPPDGLQPRFTFTPTAPQDHQRVLFDASTSQAPGNNPIVSYSWNFGDGGSATGRTATHEFFTPGTYVVSLTVTDGFGRSATTSQVIAVGAGVNPTASFVFSPTDPLPGTTVFFNASASRAAPGRTIVSYSWDFGDGTSGTGVQTSRRYTVLGSYTVTLVVTDDAGRTSSASQTVPVAFPDEEASTSPTLRKKGGTLRD